MSEEKKVPSFEELYNRDIKKYVEKLEKTYKDKRTGETKSFFLSYLSWAYGHREMKRIDPDAKEHVHEFPLVINGQVVEGVRVPYLQTPQGYFVQNTVTINGRSESEWLPVLDNSNRPIADPNSFQINTSNKRCFVKALAKHGLGLYLYVGEDLPENISEEQQEPLKNEPPKQQTNNEPKGLSELEREIMETLNRIEDLGGDRKGTQRAYLVDEKQKNFKDSDRFLMYLQRKLAELEMPEVEQETLLDGRTTKVKWGQKQ
ncbi:DUF1071 domain-containing protein [Atopococcus tabaci]|uniref:Sak single strand annealing protein n=1 Tax=Atopococcus tabaci TaxID=269774 RepID=UPI00240921A3|nr:DUF1071 domain-containing protein [Atopococcus tabaci]